MGLETLQRLLGLLDLYELKELCLFATTLRPRNSSAPGPVAGNRWIRFSYKWQSRTRDGFRVSDLYGTPNITA